MLDEKSLIYIEIAIYVPTSTNTIATIEPSDSMWHACAFAAESEISSQLLCPSTSNIKSTPLRSPIIIMY